MALIEETVSLQCDWYDPSCGFTYLSNKISFILLDLLDSFFSGILGLFELFPLPDFIVSFTTFQLPGFFLYILDVFQIYEGVLIVVSAYSIRFLIRRLPVIG